MALQRFNGVRGATGIVTARCRQQWREDHLIAAHDRYEDPDDGASNHREPTSRLMGTSSRHISPRSWS